MIFLERSNRIVIVGRSLHEDSEQSFEISLLLIYEPRAKMSLRDKEGTRKREQKHTFAVKRLTHMIPPNWDDLLCNTFPPDFGLTFDVCTDIDYRINYQEIVRNCMIEVEQETHH